MKRLQRIDEALSALIGAVLFGAFCVMLALASVQVLLRFFFNSGFVWADETARHLVIWLGFFGAYLATREKSHFHLDAFIRSLPKRSRAWVDIVTGLFSVAVLSYLVRASYVFLTVGIDPTATLFLGIPERAAAAIVPIGFALIGLQFLLRVIVDAAKVFKW